VSPDGTSGGWHEGMFSMASAEKRARIVCELRAKRACVLYARIVPKNAVGAVAIPERARGDFASAIRKTTSGRFAAFAINGLGGYGFGSNFADLREAQQRAKLECEASSARDKAKADATRRSAFEKAGLYTCQLIHSVRKR
ncbi:MAG: hypothetical protein AAFY81_08810, partial [Pseudomonadota bacterium]